jgi:glutathione S-transferase
MPIDPNAAIEITAYSWVPPGARGLVRDFRIRWTLEELGLPYRVQLYDRRVSGPEDRQPEQPFGQVPAFREGDVRMFESGAICLHLAERGEALLPRDVIGRTRAMCWTFAALNSVEPLVTLVQHVSLFDRDKPGAVEFAPTAEERLRDRLDQLDAALGNSEWLEGDFTIGDLITVSVLRMPNRSNRLAGHPRLVDYVRRGEARPAFVRALDGQMADFQEDQPA